MNLTRLHDGAFDQGLIAFDDDYRLILSKRLKDYLTHQAILDNFVCYEGKQLKWRRNLFWTRLFWLDVPRHQNCIIRR
jgi:predicted restriction endonuclease